MHATTAITAAGQRQLHLLVDRLQTPTGELVVAADQDGRLRALDWTDCSDRFERLMTRSYGAGGWAFAAASDPFGLSAALRAYFAGNLTAVADLPVATAGTAFQRAVWQALRRIPAGATLSYAELAHRVGLPKAVRAVGAANAANPVAIVVPCHRVIGASGALTGYGGGIERKRWLLAHEAAAAGAIMNWPTAARKSTNPTAPDACRASPATTFAYAASAASGS
jgi:methylated-DNA-[protein]-cysteine S-methyltransferase